MERDSMVFYRSFYTALKGLGAEEFKETILAMCEYAMDGEEPNLDGVPYMAFELMRPQIDANNTRYASGSKGGRPKKTNGFEDSENSKTNGFEDFENSKTNGFENYENQKPNVNVNVNENVNENVNVNDNENENVGKKGTSSLKKAAKPQTQEIEEAGVAPDLEQAVKDWLSYKTEKRQTYKPAGFHALLEKIKTEEARHGPAPVINAIHDAMANGWQGIAWDRIGGRSPNDKPDRIANRVREVDEWNF